MEPLLQMGQLSLGESKYLIQGHTAGWYRAGAETQPSVSCPVLTSWVILGSRIVTFYQWALLRRSDGCRRKCNKVSAKSLAARGGPWRACTLLCWQGCLPGPYPWFVPQTKRVNKGKDHVSLGDTFSKASKNQISCTNVWWITHPRL